jgi:hypothetical protein
MLGDRPRRRAQGLEAFAEQTMVGAPSRPWDVPVQRLSNQVMAKGWGPVERFYKQSC